MLSSKTLIVVANRFPTQDGAVKKGYNILTWVEMMRTSFKRVIVLIPTPFFPHLASYLPFPEIYKELAQVKNYNYENVQVHYVRFFTLPINTWRKKNDMYAAKALEKYVRKNNISGDIIHAHFTSVAGHTARVIATQLNLSFYLTLREDHTWLLEEEKNNKHRQLWSLAKKITRVNNQDVSLLKKYNKQVRNIPNPVDTSLFQPLDVTTCRKKLGIPTAKKVFLHVGYYTISQKNQINLIRAFREVLLTNPDSLLYLIGGGQDAAKIKQEIHRLKLQEKIILVGGIAHEKLPLWMNAADVFVLPSYSESFGIVLIEALACTTPCVATVNGGSEEIISSDLGILIQDPCAVEEISSAMKQALQRTWNKKKIRAHIVKTYAFEHVRKKYLEVYDA